MEKYFIQNDTTGYLVQIFELGFSGVSTEIFGKLSFDKGSVNNILDTIRGTGINLRLEANPLLTFDEFSEADEKTYTVKVTNSAGTVFNGFLKPDGVTQSFVRDLWVVDLDFIDGLGSLKDLAFVKSDGLNYTGKLSMFEVIEACLARTGLVMTINSFVDIYYIGYAGTNILKDTYVNSDRFFKIDAQISGGGTTMTCEEVLNSVLNLFSACITQQDGRWWVYRPNEFSNNVLFIDNSLNATFTKGLYKKIGSQIDNYYPHHCNGNQQIQTKGAISAYRLNYKYGFKNGLLLNPTLRHDTALVFEDWTKTSDLNGVILINDLNDTSGLLMMTMAQTHDRVKILTSSLIPINEGSTFDFKLGLYSEATRTAFNFKVKLGSYYLKYDGTWTTTDTFIRINLIDTLSNIYKTHTLSASPPPISGNLTVEIWDAYRFRSSPAQPNPISVICEVQNIEIVNTFDYDGKIGEFHTVTRSVAPSSIIKENQEIYNGDSIGDVFEGVIYKSDKSTPTNIWTRKNKLEEKPILQISAEDDMRIQQKPIKTFIGDIYGEVPYLSIIEINNISGLFMFIEYSYDTDSNITRGKLQQFFTSEVADLNFSLTFDYGNTVKPSIRS